jgi:hypothetical protein
MGMAGLEVGLGGRPTRDGHRLAPRRSRPNGGRSQVAADVRRLIRDMAAENPLWGAPRIHGELLKLGLAVSERTISRLMPRRRTPPSQMWRTFLENHLRSTVAVDFFAVPTLTCRILLVFVVLAHDRRHILHVNVTRHPTSAWTRQQLREAFPNDSHLRFVLHDRDTTFDAALATRQAFGLTAAQSATLALAEPLRERVAAHDVAHLRQTDSSWSHDRHAGRWLRS